MDTLGRTSRKSERSGKVMSQQRKARRPRRREKGARRHTRGGDCRGIMGSEAAGKATGHHWSPSIISHR